MADFCNQCSTVHFNEDFGDLKGLCAPDQTVLTICEGCGFVRVDHYGYCVDTEPNCTENHGHQEHTNG